MAAKTRIPMTPAIRALKAAGAEFTLRPYAYEDHGGTGVAARELGVDEHQVVKTLVMVDNDGRAIIMLMHGDMEVSTKALARELRVKTVEPATPQLAQKLTGYQVGGISPLGGKQKLAVYAQASIFELRSLLINAGKRGLLAEMEPRELMRLVKPTLVEAAQ